MLRRVVARDILSLHRPDHQALGGPIHPHNCFSVSTASRMNLTWLSRVSRVSDVMFCVRRTRRDTQAMQSPPPPPTRTATTSAHLHEPGKLGPEGLYPLRRHPQHLARRLGDDSCGDIVQLAPRHLEWRILRPRGRCGRRLGRRGQYLCVCSAARHRPEERAALAARAAHAGE